MKRVVALILSLACAWQQEPRTVLPASCVPAGWLLAHCLASGARALRAPPRSDGCRCAQQIFQLAETFRCARDGLLWAVRDWSRQVIVRA